MMLGAAEATDIIMISKTLPEHSFAIFIQTELDREFGGWWLQLVLKQ